MKIRDLLQEAQRLAPDMMYEAIDTQIFAASAAPTRDTYVTKAFSRKHGSGSHARIELQMHGDHVVGVDPSATNEYWQVSPLVEALRAHSDVTAVEA